MRIWITLLALAFIVPAIGCNKTNEGGTPNTDSNFKLSLPTNTPVTTIKQGQQDTVKIKVDRGNAFKQGVKVKIDTPEHIKADPADKTIAADAGTEMSVTLTVDDKCPAGEYPIKVTGTPDSGAPVNGSFNVKVENK